MNGAQDLGGQHGFGPVRPEPDEPVFHADWERRVFALTLAMGPAGGWSIDQSRFARESLPPAQYLASSYYQIWLAGLIRLLAERDLLDEAELVARRPIGPVRGVSRILTADQVPELLRRGGPTGREATSPARFAVGDLVRAHTLHPTGHIRLPRYVRGHTGVVDLVHGCHVFPDTSARGEGEQPRWLYTVRFTGTELWGPDGDPDSEVSVDAWEPYLEAA
jgi:nitrile hydratase subunit beta